MSSRVARHDPYAAFRLPGYRAFLCGSLLVQIGTGAQGVAIGWEMYQRTGQALALGLVGLAQAVPMIALSLPAGYLADRFDRKRVLMASLLGASLISLQLATLSYCQGPVALMYLLLFLDAAVLTLGRPARTALLPLLVPRAIFENAVAWRTSTQQIAAVTGPALGGFIVAASLPAAYVASAASTLLFVLLLSRITVPRREATVTDGSLASLLAGLRFVWRTKLILTTISLDLFVVLFGGAVYLLPIYARDILQVGEAGLGWLRAAPAAGAFCTAILLAHLPPMRRAGRNLLLAVAGFGVATIVFGLSCSFWLSLFMLFLTGAFDNVSVVVRHTLLQLLTPDAMRGRVSAVNAVFIGSSNELGGFESGLVAQLFSPTISVVSGGIGTLIVVGVTAARSRELRSFGALADARPVHQSRGEAREQKQEGLTAQGHCRPEGTSPVRGSTSTGRVAKRRPRALSTVELTDAARRTSTPWREATPPRAFNGGGYLASDEAWSARRAPRRGFPRVQRRGRSVVRCEEHPAPGPQDNMIDGRV